MNNLHYYPYASFTNEQMPILKSAAIYFDKLHILDPVEASWNIIGAGNAVQEVAFLKEKEIPMPIKPAEVLQKYDPQITACIRADDIPKGMLQVSCSLPMIFSPSIAIFNFPISVSIIPVFV